VHQDVASSRGTLWAPLQLLPPSPGVVSSNDVNSCLEVQDRVPGAHATQAGTPLACEVGGPRLETPEFRTSTLEASAL
jgi:hypothetical protein